MPSLVIYFARLCPWSQLPQLIYQALKSHILPVLKALVLCAPEMESLIVPHIRAVLLEAEAVSIAVVHDLVQTVPLVISSPEKAMNIFLECLEPSSAALVVQPPRTTEYLLRNLFGIALNHCDESNQVLEKRGELWTFQSQQGF